MRHGHVIGIELNEKMCQVSFYDEGLQEPHTMEVNADNYQIPLVIGRKGGSWVYGKEAQKEHAVGNAVCVFDLLNFAKVVSWYSLERRCTKESGFCPCIFSLF